MPEKSIVRTGLSPECLIPDCGSPHSCGSPNFCGSLISLVPLIPDRFLWLPDSFDLYVVPLIPVFHWFLWSP